MWLWGASSLATSVLPMFLFTVTQILLVMSKAMNEMYGSSEFFDNLNRQDLLELGLSTQNEGEDYFTMLLQRGEEMKQLEKQLKKQGS
jgi:hypothetical protein